MAPFYKFGIHSFPFHAFGQIGMLPPPVAAVTAVPSDVAAEPQVDLSSSAGLGLVAEPAVLALHSEVVKIVNNLLQSEMGRSKVVFIV